MIWPLPDEYAQAMQNPHQRFSNYKLRMCKIKEDKRGLPIVWSGNFASVFKARLNSHDIAIKCFYNSNPDRHQRYQVISSYINRTMPPFLVNLEYSQNELLIHGKRYPILTMDWIEGYTINNYIDQNIKKNNNENIKDILKSWERLVDDLKSSGIAHGDLQHGNILITKNKKLILIDYDCLYLPQLKDYSPDEIGHPSYQHPGRTIIDYDNEIDDFSILLITLSLKAILMNNDLWIKYHNGDNLIFAQEDLANPSGSNLFKDLINSNDNEVRQLAKTLYESCLKSLGMAKKWIRPKYFAEINEKQPTLFIFLIDQSISMFEKSGPTDWNQLKSEEVANAINRIIYNLLIKCSRRKVKNYIEIAAIGFGNSGCKSMINSQLSLIFNISQLYKLSKEKIGIRRFVDPLSKRIQKEQVKIKTWVEPRHKGRRNFLQALSLTKSIIKTWINDHPTSFPPIIIAYSNGESQDGKPFNKIKEITNLSTNDGNILFFNFFKLKHKSPNRMLFPNESYFFSRNEHVRQLFESSSIIPDIKLPTLKLMLPVTRSNARGFIYEGNIVDFIQFLDFATRAETLK